MAFDKDLVWNLPEGEPPYTTIPGENDELVLYHEMRRMYIFLQGDHPNQRIGNNPEEKKKLQLMRERNFVQLLEVLNPGDAKMLLAVKDKKLHKLYEGIDADLCTEAFPDVFTGLNPIQIEPTESAIKHPRRKDGKFAKKETV